MICKNCNATIPDDSIFCSYCAQRVTGAPAPTPAPTPAAVITPIPAPTAAPVIPNQSNTRRPNAAPETTHAPNSSSNRTAAPRKSNKNIFIAIAATGAAALLALVLLLAIPSGTRSAEQVVEEYICARFERDVRTATKCCGYDYMQLALEDMEELEGMDDVDDMVDYFQSWYLDDEDYWENKYGKLGMNLEYWQVYLGRVEDEEDYVELLLDFQHEYQMQLNEEYNRSYEVVTIKAEKLSGSDLRDAEDCLEDWFDDAEYHYYTTLYEEDDVKSFYLVSLKIRLLEDGDQESERLEFVVVKTSKGFFLPEDCWPM